MANETFAGIRYSPTFQDDERPKSFREMILWREPNGTSPLFALTSKIGKESLTDSETSWWEEELGPLTLTTSGAMTATATTAPVTGGALQLAAGDLLVDVATLSGSYHLDASQEVMEVATTPTSDTSVTVVRGVQNDLTNGVAVLSGAVLVKIGSAFGEGSLAADAVGRNPVKFGNFAQIFKTDYEVANTTIATKYRTGDPLKNDRKRRMFDHGRDIEMQLLFGRKDERIGANGQPKRMMGGLLESLSTAGRVTDMGGATTADTFFDNIYDVFDYRGSTGAGDERLIIGGNAAINKLNKIVKADSGTRQELGDVFKMFGMKLQSWTTPQGTYGIKSHPLLNTIPGFSNMLFVINPMGLKYRPLRDTKFNDNIQTPGQDSRKGEWLTEASFEYHHMRTMKCLFNLGT